MREHPRYRPTPLIRLAGLAAHLGVGNLIVKDERRRFGLRSFKALGGSYAVLELAARRLSAVRGHPIAPHELMGAATSPLTFTCASAGNHGQAVAATARLIGAACTVFLPSESARRRIAAIEEQGAKAVLVDGTYDAAVAQAAEMARRNGWLLVADTSSGGDEVAPRLVMLAYAVLLREAYEQIAAMDGRRPTHILVQAGVGALAGALAGYSAGRWGEHRPRLVVVEPERADCLMRSAVAGQAAATEQDLDTCMTGLACGETSPLAWETLAETTDSFVTVSDDEVAAMLAALSRPIGDDPPIATSPSGAAGLAPLLLTVEQPALADGLGLGSDSVVLAIITEDTLDDGAPAGGGFR